MRMCWN